MKISRTANERAALVVTAARLLLVPAIIAVLTVSTPLAVMLGAIFVLIDVGDGIYARAVGSESTARRILDCVVDRLAVHAGLIAVVIIRPEFAWLYVPLLARDVIASMASIWLIRYQHLLVLGGRLHAVSSLANALFGFMLLVGSASAVYGSAVLALTVNYGLLLDYMGGYLYVRTAACEGAIVQMKVRGLLGLRAVLRSVIGGSQRTARDMA